MGGQEGGKWEREGWKEAGVLRRQESFVKHQNTFKNKNPKCFFYLNLAYFETSRPTEN